MLKVKNALFRHAVRRLQSCFTSPVTLIGSTFLWQPPEFQWQPHSCTTALTVGPLLTFTTLFCFWVAKNAETETPAARKKPMTSAWPTVWVFKDADSCQDNMASVVHKRVSSNGGMTLGGTTVPAPLRPPEISQRDWPGIETGLPRWKVGDEPREPRHGPREPRHEPRVTRHEPRVTRHEPREPRHEPRVTRHGPRVRVSAPQ